MSASVTTNRPHQKYLDANGPIVGDCWRTAVACLLNLPRDEVPHFVQEYDYEWFDQTVEFVEAHAPGRTLVCKRPDWPFYGVPHAPREVIVTGGSPRGDWAHAVVCDAETGALSWDPHPSGLGTLDQEYVYGLVAKE